jgi:predicted nucleic acid-binding protein
MADFRLYIDNCALNRPFDDQTQPRVWLETLAMSLVFSMVELGEAEMIISSIQLFENRASPELLRRLWVQNWLNRSSVRVRLNQQVRTRARELQDDGLKGLDALHLSMAEFAGATDFLTCDDRVIRKYRGPIRV